MHYFTTRLGWQPDSKLQLKLNDEISLSVYWSHRELPSQEFIIFDKNAIRWRVKPDMEDGALATAIGVSPLYKDKIDFLAYTLFEIEMLIPDAIRIISVPESPVS